MPPVPHWVMLTSIVGCCLMFAQTESHPVPVANEPHHHQVLANDFVRVYAVQIPPHGSTLLHQHDRDYVVVHLSSGDVTNTPAGGDSKQSHVEAGGVQLVKAPLTHVVANSGETVYENITVVILRASPLHPPGAVPAGNFGGEGVLTRLLFENDVVRAWDTEIAPGGRQAHHMHLLPYLAIAVTGLNFSNVPDKGAAGTISHKAGDVAWMNAPYGHTLTNVSEQPARFIVLEFK